MTRRATGPSEEVRSLVLSRARYLCEVCETQAAMNVHHRKPRRMGGTRDPRINSPANLLALCGSGTTGCHGHIESHRAESYRLGWLVRWGEDPLEVPFQAIGQTWWLLDGVGGKHPAPTPR